MDVNTTRFVFFLLCALGVIGIITGSALEMTRLRNKTSLITPRHFRWRMVSACIWVLILGSLAYAVGFEWPSGPSDPRALEKMQRFGAILQGSMLLMMVAMVIFGVDLLLTLKLKRLREIELRSGGHSAPLRSEIDKILKDATGGGGNGAGGKGGKRS